MRSLKPLLEQYLKIIVWSFKSKMNSINLNEEIEVVTRKFNRRLKRFSELKILGLEQNQVYPPSLLMSPKHILPERRPLIKKSTPVGSMGSCFAREIKTYLEENKFNYVHKGEGKHADHGSAPWDRVFNTACILQEIQRAFGKIDIDYIRLKDGRVVDPFRKGVVFDSEDQAEEELKAYVKAARSALLDSRVFIFTLGLSEVWYDRISGKVFAEPPPIDVYDPKKHAFKLVSPSENELNLRKAIEILKYYNNSVDIILTVSPIPLRATFYKRSAIISNNISKASLIFCTQEIVNSIKYVHYFPAYEITYNLIEDPFEWDCRHVKKETIKKIMNMFEAVFVENT
jgi:hypothetical protein